MLQPHHFSYKCPLKISDLDETEGGHFCAKCSKDIHDLTDCSLDEVRELQRRKGSICGFVRAVGVTSMVSLAACSKGGDNNPGKDEASNTDVPKEQTVPVNAQPELMGDICIPEKEIPKPPTEQPPTDKDNAQAGTDPNQEPVKEAPIKIKPVELPVLMGVICEPENLVPKKPEEAKPLDPNREDSPA